MLDIERKQIEDVLDRQPNKVVLSNLSDKSYLYKKTVIQKIALKDRMVYQIERFTDKQAFHENVELGQLSDVVLDCFPSIYKQVNIFDENDQYDFKVTKKGKLLANVHGVAVKKGSGALTANGDTESKVPSKEEKRIIIGRKEFTKKE